MSCSRFNKKYLIKPIISLYLILFLPTSFAMEVPIYDFSIRSYTQNINDYLPTDSPDYLTPLLKPEYQASQLKQFYNHYYASDSKGLSPWSEQMVKSILPVVKKVEREILDDFDNRNQDASKQHYAENFKEHNEIWLDNVKQNMDLSTVNSSEFKEENRAIAITNTFARALPEHAPDFFSFQSRRARFSF